LGEHIKDTKKLFVGRGILFRVNLGRIMEIIGWIMDIVLRKP
jgi:hypothetical protein